MGKEGHRRCSGGLHLIESDGVSQADTANRPAATTGTSNEAPELFSAVVPESASRGAPPTQTDRGAGSGQVPVQSSQHWPEDGPVLQARPGDPASHGSHRSAQPGARSAMPRLGRGSGPTVKPHGARSAHAYLGVRTEPGQVLLAERLPAAPAAGALRRGLFLREGGHGPILASEDGCGQSTASGSAG